MKKTLFVLVLGLATHSSLFAGHSADEKVNGGRDTVSPTKEDRIQCEQSPRVGFDNGKEVTLSEVTGADGTISYELTLSRQTIAGPMKDFSVRVEKTDEGFKGSRGRAGEVSLNVKFKNIDRVANGKIAYRVVMPNDANRLVEVSLSCRKAEIRGINFAAFNVTEGTKHSDGKHGLILKLKDKESFEKALNTIKAEEIKYVDSIHAMNSILVRITTAELEKIRKISGLASIRSEQTARRE